VIAVVTASSATPYASVVPVTGCAAASASVATAPSGASSGTGNHATVSPAPRSSARPSVDSASSAPTSTYSRPPASALTAPPAAANVTVSAAVWSVAAVYRSTGDPSTRVTVPRAEPAPSSRSSVTDAVS
jgi:hypothetical protein